MSKTYKRELAMVAFLVWGLLTYRHFTLLDPALVSAQAASYSAASFSLWGFIGAMFGIHHVWDKKE